MAVENAYESIIQTLVKFPTVPLAILYATPPSFLTQ